jgi:hypothetical protein
MNAKVYTTQKDSVMQIDCYGFAKFDVPCIVPEEAARFIEQDIAGERPNPDFGKPVEPGEAPHPRTIKIARGPETRLRIEWDKPAASKPAGPSVARATAPAKPAESGE